ncbi:MAG: HD domain-containing protein [Lachnospiraceae bacterium]|nr:HD domain-containing protein [Lachnospiraceae bacterium]
MKKNDIREEFEGLIKPLATDPLTQEMKKYIQHGRISTYEHCMDVAKLSHRINKQLHLRGNDRELVRGAFLHDYFLYDWHNWEGQLHGFYHAGAALRNARRDFDLSKKEENIIGSHMWPLNLFSLPKSREAWIVCIADKIVSTKETLFRR